MEKVRILSHHSADWLYLLKNDVLDITLLVTFGIHKGFPSISKKFKPEIESFKKAISDKKGSYLLQYTEIEVFGQLLQLQKMLKLEMDTELGSKIQEISEEGDLTYLFFLDQFNAAQEFLTSEMVKKGLKI